MKTIEEAIRAASKCLEGVGIEDPRMESEFLIAALLEVPRTHLVLHRNEAFNQEKIQGLKTWLGERQKRKPLAYVSGEQPFRDLKLKVTPSVLVPRPETELVVEQALRLLDGRQNAFVVDVGTGSGNIALSLSMHPKVKNIVAIDLSPDALRVARENGKKAPRGAPIQWRQGSLLSSLLKRREKADLVVANLPYVRTEEIDALAPELQWEPRLALDGGPDGLRLIDPCIEQASETLKPGGMILLEIGAEQAYPVAALVGRNGLWTAIRVFQDFSGLPRMVQAQRKGL